jgi:MOSC domain-containing protein YiiM
MRIESIQVGLPRVYGSPDAPGWMDRPWTTGYAKHPVPGPVRVGRTHLYGDGQADRRWHGGPEMAVLAYPAVHYLRWAEELSWPDIPPGAFGENLTVSGTTEDEACLGDVWRAGGATLQISEPRKPCKNISRFWKRQELLQLVVRSGRYGFYLRVLEEGTVAAGEEVRLVERPHPEWTVARAMQARMQAGERPAEADALLRVPALGKDWRDQVRLKLAPP